MKSGYYWVRLYDDKRKEFGSWEIYAHDSVGNWDTVSDAFGASATDTEHLLDMGYQIGPYISRPKD